jgi:CRP-like cAMP-binding protein
MRKNHANRQYLDQLAGTALFEDCSRQELMAIASLCTPIDVPAGRVLTTQDELGFECFFVLNGQAVVERNGSIIGHVVEGSILGEIALLRQTTRTATVTASTDMTLLVMNRSEFASLRQTRIGSSAWDRMNAMVDTRLEVVERTPPAPVADPTPEPTPEPAPVLAYV